MSVVCGDARSLPLADASVDCVVSSPPYWCQRDYGVAGQLGLEQSPGQWVAELVEVFREVRRVLKPWGTLWLNVGDKRWSQSAPGRFGSFGTRSGSADSLHPSTPEGLKPLDMAGLPWALAAALRADGWYLRAEIIWQKPTPQPEALKGWQWEARGGELRLSLGAWRPTTAHEPIFLLAPSRDYYVDAFAMLEPCTGNAKPRGRGLNPKSRSHAAGARQNPSFSSAVNGLVTSRNPRSVWRIPPEPFRAQGRVLTWDREMNPECPVHAGSSGTCRCALTPSTAAHHATYPSELAARCIQGATPDAGVCADCGKPWVRIVDQRRLLDGKPFSGGSWNTAENQAVRHDRNGRSLPGNQRFSTERISKGWKPICECGAPARPALVLDPFSGTAATGQAAVALGRRYIGVDLSVPTCRLAQHRLSGVQMELTGLKAG